MLAMRLHGESTGSSLCTFACLIYRATVFTFSSATWSLKFKCGPSRMSSLWVVNRVQHPAGTHSSSKQDFWQGFQACR